MHWLWRYAFVLVFLVVFALAGLQQRGSISGGLQLALTAAVVIINFLAREAFDSFVQHERNRNNADAGAGPGAP